jgi:hypothetical protein
MKFLYTLLFMVFLISCSNSSNINTENIEKPFFDLKGFFEKEIANQEIKTIEKTVKINKKSETKTLTDFDLEKELKLFLDCDINNPSLFDKYKTEKSSEENIIYTALNEDLKVQKIEILKSDDTVEKIIVHKKVKTQIYNSEKILTYEPNVGYSIENSQKTLGSDKKDYEIKVVFK